MGVTLDFMRVFPQVVKHSLKTIAHDRVMIRSVQAAAPARMRDTYNAL
jgi:hypothetical protein